MCGIKQFIVLQTTQCALFAIGINHTFAKCRLMDTSLYNCGYVPASNFRDRILGHM